MTANTVVFYELRDGDRAILYFESFGNARAVQMASMPGAVLITHRYVMADHLAETWTRDDIVTDGQQGRRV